MNLRWTVLVPLVLLLGCGDDASADVCCAPDETQAACMNLGGTGPDCALHEACDFWCSTAWRLEKNADGCEAWVYETRQPAADEDPLCRKQNTPP